MEVLKVHSTEDQPSKYPRLLAGTLAAVIGTQACSIRHLDITMDVASIIGSDSDVLVSFYMPNVLVLSCGC